jgi:hypothetical protein
MLSPNLVWGGLVKLPIGPPRPPNIAQAEPILNILLLCVAKLSHVHAILFCSSHENSTGGIDLELCAGQYF